MTTTPPPRALLQDMFQAAIIPAVIGVVVLAYCRLMAPRARPAPPPSS